MYNYANNNPITYIDPDGKIPALVEDSFCLSINSGNYDIADTFLIIGITSIAVSSVILFTCITGGIAAIPVAQVFLYGVSISILVGEGIDFGSNFSRSFKKKVQIGNYVATSQSPSSANPNNNNDDDTDIPQSAKDAKKLDNKGADKLAQEKGYNDAHDLKTDYVKGLKDKKIDHYNLYKNSKTGESFMIHNETKLTIPLE